MSEKKIINNTDESRYEIHVDGVLAGIEVYVDEGDLLAFVHTEVFEEFSGQGLAAILVTGALDDVRSEGRVIRADCPYVAAFLTKHPDYQDLVA